jgi:hypothetical protein
MKEINIRIRPMTEGVIKVLEDKGLISRFMPTAKVLSTPEKEIGIEYLYTTDPKFGPHMVICVGFNRSYVDMAYHNDNEDFILINEGRQQKPLILIIGLYHEKEFQTLISTGQLTEDDIWAIELKFNDPKVSFFTMNGFTPHCEWTIAGTGSASIFYVSEPRNLDTNHIHMGDYELKISF